MRSLLKRNLIIFVLAGAFLVAGCAHQLVNLTASRLPRNPSGVYNIEAQFGSSQQSLRKGSIRPFVLVGTEAYPMRQTIYTTNRWEAPVPIPGSQKQVRYKFKVDYDYNRFGSKGQSSLLSPEYTLDIVD